MEYWATLYDEVERFLTQNGFESPIYIPLVQNPIGLRALLNDTVY